jgi:hypothetical protein
MPSPPMASIKILPPDAPCATRTKAGAGRWDPRGCLLSARGISWYGEQVTKDRTEENVVGTRLRARRPHGAPLAHNHRVTREVGDAVGPP